MAGAERILIMSNAPLTSVLPSAVDLNSFLAQHTVIFNSGLKSIVEFNLISYIYNRFRNSNSFPKSILHQGAVTVLAIPSVVQLPPAKSTSNSSTA